MEREFSFYVDDKGRVVAANDSRTMIASAVA